MHLEPATETAVGSSVYGNEVSHLQESRNSRLWMSSLSSETGVSSSPVVSPTGCKTYLTAMSF